VHYCYLVLAIVCEVVATTALKAADGFRAPGPTLLVLVGYTAAFYLLSLTLRTMPVGIAYAIWSGHRAGAGDGAGLHPSTGSRSTSLRCWASR